MPIIPTVDRKVAPQAMPAVRQSSKAFTEDAFGSDVGQTMAYAGAKVEKQALIKQDQDDTKAVLDATTAYKQDLATRFNGEGGFYTLEGNNAKDISTQAGQYMDTVRQGYQQNLTKRQALAFQAHIADTESSYYKGAIVHQEQQGEIAFANSTNANIEMSGKLFQDNSKNDAMAITQLKNIDQSVALFGARKGWDANQIKNKQLQMKSQTINDTFTSLMGADKLDDAKRIMDVYGPTIDKKNYGAMQAVFREKTDKLQTKTTAKDIVANSGSLQEALGKVGIANNPNTSTWAQTKELVSGNESGGDTNALNGDSGAKGKYQFMPETWKAVMGDAPMTPENQEIAFEKKYKPIFDKYGTKGVLVAVYAGDQNAERYANGQPLIGDNGNEYSADDPQYSNGNKYPSVNEYVQKGIGSGQGPLAQAEYQQKLTDQVKSEWGVKQAIKAEETKNKMEGFGLYLTQNKPKSVDDIEAAAINFGFTGTDLIHAIGTGKQYAGLLKIEEGQAQDEAYKAALQDVYDGSVKDLSSLQAKYGATVGIQHLISLSSFLEATVNKSSKVPIELQNKDNLMAFEGVIKELGLDKTEGTTVKSRIFSKVTDQVLAAKAKGTPISRDDIEAWTREQGQKVVIDRTWYGAPVTTYIGNVPSTWTINGKEVTDTNGIKATKFENGKWYTTINGVDIEMRE